MNRCSVFSGLEPPLASKTSLRLSSSSTATKNEAESVMEDAIGRKIDDYLTKPVNPAQILAACRNSNPGRAQGKFTKDYTQGFNDITRRLFGYMDWNEWLEVYQKLVGWSMELDQHPELGFGETLANQWRECNSASDSLRRAISIWIDGPSDDTPLTSPHIIDKHFYRNYRVGKPDFLVHPLYVTRSVARDGRAHQAVFHGAERLLFVDSADGDTVCAECNFSVRIVSF